MADKMLRVIHCASGLRLGGRDVFDCGVNVSLTLLEGALVWSGPPPEGQNGVVYVTGQCGWLLHHSWAIRLARVAALFAGQRIMRSTVQSPGDLQRKVVMAAAIMCAFLLTHGNVQFSFSNRVHGSLLSACPSPWRWRRVHARHG